MHVIGIDTGHLSDAAQANAWLQETDPPSALSCVGYLSMEFILSEALPIYKQVSSVT